MTAPTLNDNTAGSTGAFARTLTSLGSIAGPLIGLVLVIAIFGVWRPETFLSQQTFHNVLRNNYHFVVAAVGATFVIITAGIDLSVGSTMALASVCCALVMRGFSTPDYDWGQSMTIAGGTALLAAVAVAGWRLQRGARRWRALVDATAAAGTACIGAAALWYFVSGRTLAPQSILFGIIAGIAVGAMVGMINGLLVTTLALPPFIVTLAMLEAVRGMALYITRAIPVSDLPREMPQMHYGSWWGLPPNVWIALLVVLLAIPVLHYTVLGRYAYAIGSNERTARLCGIRVERWKTACYVIAGMAAGLAGVMMAAKLRSGQPDEFRGVELTIIAAVVIGGTSLFGGEGTVLGSVLGVLMLAFLYTGCNIADISPYVQRIFIGGTIILAAAIDRFRHSRR